MLFFSTSTLLDIMNRVYVVKKSSKITQYESLYNCDLKQMEFARNISLRYAFSRWNQTTFASLF